MDLQYKNRWLLLNIDGRIDSFNYDHVTSKINTLVKMGKKHIALDISDVDFLSFASLQYFVRVAKRLKKNQGQLIFISPKKEIFSDIETLNQKKWIRIEDSIDQLTTLENNETKKY